MLIEFLDLKGDNCCRVESVHDNDLISPPSSHKYKLNSSLILLFSFKKEKVFFSYLLGKIFKISSKDYNQYIEHFSNKRPFPKIMINLSIVVPLKEEPNKIKQPKFFFRNLQLNLAPQCNLRCKYCYASSGRRPDKNTMPFRVAKKAVDYVSNFCGDRLELQFVGAGEPTLYINFIKRIFRYAKKKVKHVEINPIITNGVISSSVAKWLSQNAYVQISCDGPPSIQDKYRPLADGGKSSPFVEKTIKYFVSTHKPFQTRATLVEDIFGREKEVINYFFNLGIQYLNFSGLENVGAAKKMSILPEFHQRKSLDKEMVAEEIKKLMELEEELGMKSYTTSIRQVGSQVTCPIYTKNKFVVDYYGNVSACEDYNGPFDIEEHPFFQDLIIGRYNFQKDKFEINLKKLDKIKETIDKQMQINKCFSCPLFSSCTKICLYQIGVQTGSIFTDYPTCDKVGKTWPTLTVKYLASKYLLKKKPCLEIDRKQLFYSLFFNRFKLHLQKASSVMRDNPYIYITGQDDLNVLLNRIIKYKNTRKNLTLFLLKFKFNKEDLNLKEGRIILRFFKKLRESHVYFRISAPLPKELFGFRYGAICREFNLPLSFKDSLELYIVKNNYVIFPNGKKGGKRFSEYSDREEIYNDFLKS